MQAISQIEPDGCVDAGGFGRWGGGGLGEKKRKKGSVFRLYAPVKAGRGGGAGVLEEGVRAFGGFGDGGGGGVGGVGCVGRGRDGLGVGVAVVVVVG